MQIHVFDTADEVIKALADFFIDTANNAIKKMVNAASCYQAAIHQRSYMNY